ncbi:MAG: MBL fold metallo-hydrolase [Terriglobia bacterium]
MILETIPVGPLQCNCYILGCEQSQEAIVIDPGEDADLILPILEKHQLKVKFILTTHAHIDHVGDLETVRAKTGAEALLHEKDLMLYDNLPIQAAWLGLAIPPKAKINNYVHEGDALQFGRHRGEILYTPGHTPGSVCLYLSEQSGRLFAGDTLFRRSIGRTDLWGGSYESIIQSIHDKLFALDDETVVYPGHGPITTIGEEKHNPFF